MQSKREHCEKKREGGNVYLCDRVSAFLVLATVREERRGKLLPPAEDFFIFAVDEEFVKVATLEIGRIVVCELWL